MKKSIKNKGIFLLLSIISCSFVSLAQSISCSYEPIVTNFSCSSSGLKSANTTYSVDEFKTIRVNIHFMLLTDGTGNFTETQNINGTTSSQNGYWFAQKCIEICNAQLSNEIMTQQLSYETIPVNEINYGYKLCGIFFHRNNSYFNSPNLYSNLYENSSEVINIFIYPNNEGNGVSSGTSCWIGGALSAYTNYLTYGNWGFEGIISRLINHEVGHCLSLDHCKRYPYGDCCLTNSSSCLDNCDDTPTYLELTNDGFSDPCIWNGTGYSNNIMDYSPNQKAYTPCQIEQVHYYIENNLTAYRNENFNSSTIQITSFTDNKTYIGESATIPSGYTVTVSNNKRLFIESKTLTINGAFSVPIGSVFEYVPNGM